MSFGKQETKRRPSTNGYLSSIEFERQPGLGYVNRTGFRPGTPSHFWDHPVTNHCFALAVSPENAPFIMNGSLVCIKSIRITNPGVPIVVLHTGLSERQKESFGSVTFIEISPEFGISDFSSATRPDVLDATFLKLYVDKIEDFDTVIYVDGDAVVLEKLDDLFNLDVPFAAGFRDGYPLSEQFERGHELLASEGLSEDYAFNAGVMRYDLRFWRTRSLSGEALVLCQSHGWNAFRFADQSLLNLIVRKESALTPISRLYNFCRWPDMLRQEHKVVANDQGLFAPAVAEGTAKIVHWNGPVKPWSREAITSAESPISYCLECYDQFL